MSAGLRAFVHAEARADFTPAGAVTFDGPKTLPGGPRGSFDASVVMPRHSPAGVRFERPTRDQESARARIWKIT